MPGLFAWPAGLGDAAVGLGSVLTLANQFDAVLGEASINWLQLALVYCTPFIVVCLSQLLGMREARKMTNWAQRLDERFFVTLVSHGIPRRPLLLSLAVGGANTAIVAIQSDALGQGFGQIPLALVVQTFALPTIFGSLSQAQALRKSIKPKAHSP